MHAEPAATSPAPAPLVLDEPSPTSRARSRDPGERTRRERDALVLGHLDLVEPYVRRYAYRGVPRDDLRQIGRLALVEAASRFDPEQGRSFEAFASVTIAGTLKRHFRDRTWASRPPRALAELHLRVRRTNDDLTQILGRNPTIAELAGALEVDEDRIHEALEAASAHTAASLDAPAGPGGDADPLWMRIGSPDVGFAAVEQRVDLQEALADLGEEDRELLRLRFLDELSQRELATLFGLSQSYVSRVLRRVLAQLHGELETEPG